MINWQSLNKPTPYKAIKSREPGKIKKLSGMDFKIAMEDIASLVQNFFYRLVMCWRYE